MNTSMILIPLLAVFALSAPTPAQAPRPPAGPPDLPVSPQVRNIELEGRIAVQDKGSYQEHVFEVPPGVTRLEIEFSYLNRAAGSELEIGLFDPQRFRGTSRFSKQRFHLTEFEATPSYLTGAIVPGTWRVSIGVPAISADTAWRATIRMSTLSTPPRGWRHRFAAAERSDRTGGRANHGGGAEWRSGGGAGRGNGRRQNFLYRPGLGRPVGPRPTARWRGDDRIHQSGLPDGEKIEPRWAASPITRRRRRFFTPERYPLAAFPRSSLSCSDFNEETLSMRHRVIALAVAAALSPSVGLIAGTGPADGEDTNRGRNRNDRHHIQIEIGPRPFFLINDLDDGRLKRELSSCSEDPLRPTDFTIGHRGGATLQFPEETREDFEAGIRMGAGIVECDVTFTKDLELVCRHAQNDLHTTTNILVTPLASKCAQPFTPAVFDASGTLVQPAAAECRTSDVTLAEFKTLTGKMDGFNPNARTAQEYLAGTPNFRTDVYAGPTSGHLLTHKESIELINKHGLKMTPELKSPVVAMPFNGLTQEAFAQKMIDEYKAASISPRRVFPQSFDQRDILYWIAHDPAFGRQAVYLDDANVVSELPGFAELVGYKQLGINIVAPPTFALVSVNGKNRIVPSQYAKHAKAAGLEIITWTLERSGVLALRTDDEFYYQTVSPAITREGDTLKLLDVLARDVGIRGIFTDWAATVSYYANCMGLK